MDDLERVIEQHRRTITTALAATCGVGADHIARLVALALWERVVHGAYAVPPFVEPQLVVHCRAVLLHAGPDTAISGRTRLALLDLTTPPDGDLVVAVRWPRHPRRTPGFAPHSVKELVVEHDPRWPELALVPVPRAAIHEWNRLTKTGDRQALLCSLVADDHVTTADLLLAATDLRITDRKEFLATCADVELGCESPVEITYLRGIERAFRLPPAERQVTIALPSGERRRVDVLYRKQKLIIEIDGRWHTLDAEQRKADELRDWKLRALGYRIIRVTLWQIRHEPGRVVAEIRAELATVA